MKNALILIVEDEAPQAEMIRYNLEKANFRTLVATDGKSGLELAETEMPDIILLDWMLPEMSGIEVCRNLRRHPELSDVPIIMLTARGEQEDKVKGLENGADDYLIKPYYPSELVARVKAILRRSQPSLSKDELTAGDITVDLRSHKTYRNSREIHLGPKEYRLLCVFLEQPGRVFSREQLLDRVWGHGIYVEERTVDVHIRRLRKALNQNQLTDRIRTIRGAGYALD